MGWVLGAVVRLAVRRLRFSVVPLGAESGYEIRRSWPPSPRRWRATSGAQRQDRAARRRAAPAGRPSEVDAAAPAYLAGELRQRQTGVGYASLRDLPPPAAEPTLTVAEVDAAFARSPRLPARARRPRGGTGRRPVRRRPPADEQRLLVGLLSGELRQGAQAGLLVDAVARAAGVPVAAVRRALLLAGDLEAGGGGRADRRAPPRWRRSGSPVGRPLAPMLAQSAADRRPRRSPRPAPRPRSTSKLDGIRIQVHRDGDDGRRVQPQPRRHHRAGARGGGGGPGAAGPAVVLDGEAIGARRDRPAAAVPGDVASRGRPPRRRARRAAADPVLLRPAAPRRRRPARRARPRCAGPRSTRLVPAALLVGRTARSTARSEAAEAFAGRARRRPRGRGGQGADAPYDVGRRGAAWVKVKPRHTLDLVVLAVEWGHGRRKGWLSNLHLGARDPRTGGFVMLGKTFKGMTDEMLRWQTERLRELAVERDDWVVTVRPEQVVEIAFDGVQTQPRYPGRGGAAVRPGPALPRGQARRGGRHDRRRAGHPHARRSDRPTS